MLGGKTPSVSSSLTCSSKHTLTRLYVGDIIYINKFGNPIIVLNNVEATNELLDKRSSNYSSRPRRTMFDEL